MRKGIAHNVSHFLCSSLLAACGGATAHMAHPLQHGVSKAPEAVATDTHKGWESEFDVPSDSLTEKALLLSATPDELCIQVQIALFNEDAAHDLSAWTYRLTVDGDTSKEVSRAAVSKLSETQYPLQGTVLRSQQNGTTTSCAYVIPAGGSCSRWETKPNYDLVRVAKTFNLVKRDYRMCFANTGLSPRSSGLHLVLTPPEGSGADNEKRSFKWKFD